MIARKPKRDTRLLQQRHQGWYFVQPVPRALQAKLRKRLIVVSMRTQSLQEAQGKRTAMEHEWEQVFERAKRGAALSGSEVEEQAREVYQGLLDRLGADMTRGKATPDGIDAYRDQAIADLEEENWTAVAPEIAAIERRTGAKIEPGEDLYRTLAGAVLGAQINAAGDYLRGLKGQAPETVWAVPVQRAPQPVVHDNPGYSEVAERYLAKRQTLSESTRRRLRTAYRLFADYSGNAPLAAIDRKMASSFLDTIAKLDPYWGQRKQAHELPLRELLKRFPGQLTNAALNHYASGLKSMFDWALDRGDVEGNNPFSRQSQEVDAAGWEPYAPKELKTLISGLEGQMREITLVALYSGMRQGELLQLTGDDVQHEGGVYFFDLHKGLQLKTKAAVRRVPLHSALMGLELHKRKGPLWPEWEGGVYFSKRFVVARRRLGLTRKGLSFHSTRGNFVTALNQAGVHTADIGVVVGHSQGFTLDRYSGGPGIKRLQEIVEQAQYPGL